ncbi:MAG: alanine--tRNA ligase, partial [Alphaproteobacteria bacterium]|nr:alanine--tRNA ligase [Alphaproteobacteria bacterium]
QKGSLVAPERLRFDISHPKPMAPEEIKAVEAEVNLRVRVNDEVTTRFMTPDEAIKAGALALFGEKYGDEVRVVSMGGPRDLGAESATGGGHFSTELCGGTHVRRTGDIGLFKIVGEGAVSAGVRRIEALTGAAALAYVGEQEALVEQAAAALKAPAAELPERVAALMEERRKLEREIAELRKRLAVGGTGGGDEVRTVRGVKYAAKRLDGVPAGELKGMVDELKKKLGSGVVALVAVEEGKASLVVGVTADLAATLSAVDLVRVGSVALGGKGGGGRPEMAQAGGPDVGQADAALAAIAGDIEKRAA